MRQMAGRIEALNPGGVNIYSIDWATLGLTTLNSGATNALDPTRHHVVLFDWGATSDFDPILCQAPSGNQNGFAYAAGDAMVSLLRNWSAATKVTALIGFSRGAIVVSEAARRLMVAGASPGQVVFLDGEGCEAGGTNGCTFYQDGRFDAWSIKAGTVRFDNLYETVNEHYLAPTFCGTDLGGHSRARCGNLNLAAAYAHTPWSLTSSCLPSYGQGSIQNYLINGLSFSGGRYTYPQAPGPVQDPSAPAAGSDPIAPVFNGGFSFASLAGWAGQGGGGTGTVSSLAGAPTIRMLRGQARTHNYIVLPACPGSLSFKAAVEGTSHGDSVLRIFMQPTGLPEATIGSVPLTQLSTTFGAPQLIALAPGLADDVVRVRFAVEGTTGTSAAHVTEVTLAPCAPVCYANCDGSSSAPRLTANDFQCFLNRFAAGESYANCDQSTSVPSLTSNDFQCFLNAFAAGCV